MAHTLSVEEVDSDRPASEVWERLTDWENAHQWMPGIDGMAADGETAAGTTACVPCSRLGALEHHSPLRRGYIDRSAFDARRSDGGLQVRSSRH